MQSHIQLASGRLGFHANRKRLRIGWCREGHPAFKKRFDRNESRLRICAGSLEDVR
jgi:hypothetical protein